MAARLRFSQDAVSVFEVLSLLIVVPIFLFPTVADGRPAAAGLAIVGFVQVVRVASRQQMRAPLVGRIPIAILLIMAAVGWWISPHRQMSSQRFYGLILGIVLYFVVVHTVNTSKRLELALWMFSLAVVIVALVGLVAADWSVSKIPVVGRAFEMLPRVFTGIRTSTSVVDGLNPNEIGGILALGWPALLVLPLAIRYRHGELVRQIPMPVLYWLVILANIFVVGVLIATLSLSAWVGSLVGIAVLIALLRPRVLIVAAAGAIVVVLAVGASRALLGLDPPIVGHLAASTNVALSVSNLPLRVELWERGLYILQDFPITGIGLNTAPLAIPNLYPLVLASDDPRPPPHVHDFFLQAGVDFGIPGMLATLWLVGLALRLAWLAAKPARGLTGLFAVGSLAGLLAFLTYGLTDAVALGAKAGVMLWWLLGTAEATWRVRLATVDAERH